MPKPAVEEAASKTEEPVATPVVDHDVDDLGSGEPFVVCVKKSESANGGPYLVYTKGMAHYWYFEPTEKMERRMGEHPRQFFMASMKNGSLKFGKYASWQDW